MPDITLSETAGRPRPRVRRLKVIGLAFLVICLGVWLVSEAVLRWWHNRYRSAALQELAKLDESKAAADPIRYVGSLNAILKRTALVAWPREQVAALSGESWIAFLTESGGAGNPGRDQAIAWTNIVWEPARLRQLNQSDLDQLGDLVRAWIRHHDPAAGRSFDSQAVQQSPGSAALRQQERVS